MLIVMIPGQTVNSIIRRAFRMDGCEILLNDNATIWNQCFAIDVTFLDSVPYARAIRTTPFPGS